MMAEALLLAAFLHVPLHPLAFVYSEGGLDAVAVVSFENWTWKLDAVRIERDSQGYVIGTSYGLGQLFDRYHKQWRDDPLMHIVTMLEFLRKCAAGSIDLAHTYSWYNSWTPDKSLEKGKRVQKIRDRLHRWLVAHMGIAGGGRR